MRRSRMPTMSEPQRCRDEAQQLMDEKTQLQRQWYEE